MAGIRDDYDVIIIGAGIGGLTCGALLASNMKSVLVVEQASQPGGYCSTFEHHDYFFDIGLNYLTGCEPGGVIYQTLEDLNLAGTVRFEKLEPAKKIIGNDYTLSITTPSDLERSLIELFPRAAPDIRKFMAGCKAVAGEMKSISGVSYDSMNVLSKKYYDVTELFKHGNLRKYRGKSIEEVFAGFFKESKTEEDWQYINKLQAILLSAAHCTDPGMMALIPMMLLGSEEGCYYPIGGAKILAARLAERITNYYSELILNTTVDKILMEKGKACGVVLSDGRQVRSRYVVSNVDARQTFLNLVGEEYLSSRFRKNLETSKLSRSAFIVSLGVKSNLRIMGYDGSIIVCNPGDDLEELFGTDPEKCMVTIAIHSITDPDLAWDSTTGVQLIAMLPYDAVEDWEAEKEDIAQKLILSAERAIPHLSQNILCKHIITPLNLEQITMNSRGACMGWYPAPKSSVRKQKTPIKNLYQAGHWTFPGGGVPAVVASGRNAARLILGGKHN